MSKSVIKPKRDVVYECYHGFIDYYGDRARRGQKFVVSDYMNGNKTVVLAKASGRGVKIAVDEKDFAKYFCPATPEKEVAAPQAAEAPFGVEAHLISGSWDDVKEYLSEMPEFIQALLKKAKPELFEKSGPKAFEFKDSDNTFGISAFDTPFYVGKGIVNTEDCLKSLVVSIGWKAELFEGPYGHQCIRFVEKVEE